MTDRTNLQPYLCFIVAISAATSARSDVFHAQGEMCGEVSESSAILQSRLTATSHLQEGDVPGAAGVARFEVSMSPDFRDAQTTPWMRAAAATDFIVKKKVTGLQPATRNSRSSTNKDSL